VLSPLFQAIIPNSEPLFVISSCSFSGWLIAGLLISPALGLDPAGVAKMRYRNKLARTELFIFIVAEDRETNK